MNGVVLYINPQLKPELALTDDHGKFVEVEVNLPGTKTLILEFMPQMRIKYSSIDDLYSAE